jgi:hypothetical protein
MHCFVLLVSLFTTSEAESVTLIGDGKCRTAICVPSRIMAPDDPKIRIDPPRLPKVVPEYQRRRLRASVRDLSRCLKEMSGLEVEIIVGRQTTGDERIPILVGEFAQKVFGPPKKTYPYKQGFRVAVSDKAIGLIGESDLAISYAVYEVLDRLGCRWFIPSEMGEVIPELKTVAMPVMDYSATPGTYYRGIWQTDEDYKRRNRMGGMVLAASHALGSWLKEKDLKDHQDWRAIVNGKPARERLKWSRPEVAEAIANKIIEYKEMTAITSASLSPEDGLGFDESEDPKMDAGDFDPVHNMISITDRLMVICNRVAGRVTMKHPDMLFGVIAYVNYGRAPVREKLHPNIVPVIAPITYTRCHPVTDDRDPNNKALRDAIIGWGKAARMTGMYWFGWNLAEMTAPNPMIAKWSIDIPFLLKNGCKFFQPETSSTFESTLHALYLGPKLAFNPNLDPKDIVDDLNRRFYVAAAKEMAAYWEYVDRIWVDTPEFSGAGFGHARRFTPARMKKMRELMNAAKRRAKTPQVKTRIKMADESLFLFQQYMKMRWDLNEGRWARLENDAERWMGRTHAMAERHRSQYAFSARQYGAGGIWGSNDGVDNFVSLTKATYDDASRVAKHYEILTPKPLREWRAQADKKKEGEAKGWSKHSFDDSSWKTTDVGIETWSTMGYHNYYGRMWYRSKVTIPAAPDDKRTYLWLGSTDGSTKVFINGKPIPYVDQKGKKRETFAGFCRPASFNITGLFSPDKENTITIRCDRTALNEIGTGGLLSPAAIYRDRF